MPTNELKTILKRLRLSGMLESLQDRIAYAKGVKLSYLAYFPHFTNVISRQGFDPFP